MPRGIFWFVSLIIILFGIAFAIWFGAEGWSKTVYYAAPIIGSLLVATGWIVTSLNTITNNEREHTLRALSEYHRDQEIKTRWKIIYNYLGSGEILKPSGKNADYPSDHEIYDAVFEQLNACEYIAVGAMKGVYDNAMLKNDLEEEFVDFYKSVKDYIQAAQAEANDFEIWEWYCKLCERWVDERDRRFGKGRYPNPYSLFRELGR
jgi:Domain of unknown function (DUF4760)